MLATSGSKTFILEEKENLLRVYKGEKGERWEERREEERREGKEKRRRGGGRGESGAGAGA